MWPKIFPRKTPGPSQSDQLLTALLDQNALLRALLKERGVHVDAPSQISTRPPRRATEKDVTSLTREDLLSVQMKQEASADEKIARSSTSAPPDQSSPAPTEKG